MKKTKSRAWGALLVVLVLVGSWTVSATAAPPPRPAEQTEVPTEDVINRLSGFFSSTYSGYCFNSWIRLGDVSKARARLDEYDVEVYVDPAFLATQEALAAYVDYSYAGLEYFNDIVLADVPANVPAQTLWHGPCTPSLTCTIRS